MKSQALLVTTPDTIEVGEIEVPCPRPDEVLIEVAYSCISPGTELRGMAGQQGGIAGFPYVPGYSQSGTVVEAGADSGMSIGQRVFCNGTTRAETKLMWGGHCQFAVRDAASVFTIPENVSLLDASVAKLAAIAQRGVNLDGASIGESVAVVGLGAIGQLSARLHALTGATVCGVDLSESRVRLLRASGIEARTLRIGALQGLFADIFPDGVHIVVDATGNPAVLEQTLQIGRIKEWNDPAPGPRLLIQGSYPASFSLPYDEAFQREVSILFPRDQTSKEVGQVLRSMAEGQLRVADLISRVLSPIDCQSVYDDLRARQEDLLTAVFRWK